MSSKKINYFKRLLFVSSLLIISLTCGIVAANTSDWLHFKYTELIKLSDIHLGLFKEQKCFIVYGCEDEETYTEDTFKKTNYTLLIGQILYSLYLFVMFCYLMTLWFNMIIKWSCSNENKFTIRNWYVSLINISTYIVLSLVVLVIANTTINNNVTHGSQLEKIGYGLILYLVSVLLGLLITFLDIYYKIKEKRCRSTIIMTEI